MIKNILVICTANICRSPYAQYKLNQLNHELNVVSAGVSVSKCGFGGIPADPNAVRIAQSRDIDMSGHKAVQVTPQHIEECDLVFAMNRTHVERIAELVPEARHKTFLLGHWVGIKEIIDPFNQSDDIFNLSFSQIDISLKSWIRKLNK